MAAVTPVVTRSTSGFVDPGFGVYGGVNPINTNLIDVGTSISNRIGYQLSIFFFSAVNDTDDWTSDMNGIIAVAWQPDQANEDICAVTLTTQGTGQTSAVVTWNCQNSSSGGWLWVLHQT